MTVRITQPANYRIISRLDVGGMAEVFLAEQTWGDASRRIALKRLLPTLARDPQHRAMFLEEARIVAGLHHPAIPAVYGLLDGIEPPALAMEWVRGVSLRELLNDVRSGKAAPFSAAEVRTIAGGLLDALDYLSGLSDERGVPAPLYHRDLAPENILIDSSGRVRLVDFGIAKSSSSRLATETGILKGRLAYLPPEVARGEPFGPTGDLYALGLILVELFTGVLPGYEPDSAKQLMALKERSGAPPLPESLRGREQFERLLAAGPDGRPASPAECAALIELALGPGTLTGEAVQRLKARVEACRTAYPQGLSSDPEDPGLYWGGVTPVIPKEVVTPELPSSPPAGKNPSRAGRVAVAFTIMLAAMLSWTYENRYWELPWLKRAVRPEPQDAVRMLPAPVVTLPMASVEIQPNLRGELLVSGESKGFIESPVVYQLRQGAYTLELKSPPDRFYRADLFLKAGEKTVWAPADTAVWK